jgi:hypothetical protein
MRVVEKPRLVAAHPCRRGEQPLQARKMFEEDEDAPLPIRGKDPNEPFAPNSHDRIGRATGITSQSLHLDENSDILVAEVRGDSSCWSNRTVR